MPLQGLHHLITQLEPTLVEELKDFAEEWEEWAREHKTWKNDTGSAQAALTAWVIDHQDYQKNFDKEPWVSARSGKIEGAYTGPPFFNTPANYNPVITEEDAGEDHALVVCLSHFVRYGPNLEEDEGGHLLQEALDYHVEPFIRHIENAFNQLIG